MFVPDSCRLAVLKAMHDSPIVSHFGKHATLDKRKRRAYWPDMATFIGEYVKTCDPCQRAKARRHAATRLLSSRQPSRSWDALAGYNDGLHRSPTMLLCEGVYLLLSSSPSFHLQIPIGTQLSSRC